jgi:hypothetical protein
MPPRSDLSLRPRLATLLALAATLTAPAAMAAPLTFPGCGATLQVCVDAAASGDTVELATDSWINEAVTVTKSLTVQAAAGRRPGVRSLVAVASVADMRVEFAGLHGDTSLAGILAPGGASLDFTATRNQLETSTNAAIEARHSSQPGTYGALTAHITDNTIIHRRNGSWCGSPMRVLASYPGPISTTIARNRITAVNLTECALIELYATTGPFHVLAQHNTLRGTGGFNNGISLRSQGGAVTAAVLNNVISGQRNFAGGPAAITLYAEADNAHIDAQVLHNTIVGNEVGLNAGARTDLGARLTGRLANNIFAHHTRHAFWLDSDEVPDFLDSYNLVFDAPPLPPTGGPRPYGPGTRTGNPQFGDPEPGDFSLRPGSDAIDYGSDTLADARVTQDLLGQPRRVRTVDMGAYEFQGTPLPQVRIANASAIEGPAGGTQQLHFAVTLSATPTAPVSLHWRTANGTANAPADYISGLGSLTWPAGDNSARTISISVQGDDDTEPSETLLLLLENVTGATAATAQAIGTIVSDDGAPGPADGGAHPVPALGPAGLISSGALLGACGAMAARRRRKGQPGA